MKITKEVQVSETAITGIECDKCHEITNVDNSFKFEEMISIEHTGGYGSKIGDGTTWECDLCESCFQDMFKDICRKK